MRILVLTNHYPPQAIGSYELQCYQICHELTNRGYQITVLTSALGPDGNSHLHHTPGRIFRELGLYDENPDADPGFHRLYKIVRNNRAILARHLAQCRPDVVMVWGMDRLQLSLLELVEAGGTPVVYSVYDYWLAEACDKDHWLRFWRHDALSPPVSRSLLRALRLENFVQRQAACGTPGSLRLENIYFCSESLKRETTAACSCELDHALVIPCGISTGSIRRKEGLSAYNYRLLYVARLTEEKDPMTALRAIQELRRRGDDRFTLDIYGRGRPEFEGALHDYVRRFQLGGTVSFKPMAEEQVRNNIHLYDALIFTSKYPEPFPLIHLKSMAARVPVISTIEGGSGELIRHGENGLIFETANHHQLADRIGQIADDPELARRLVENAYGEVTQHYTLARVTSRIESLLHRAARTEGALEEAV